MIHDDSFQSWVFPWQIVQGVPAKVLEDGTGTTQPGTKTFIDCDDLTDLTRLFSHVGQDWRG